MKYYEPDYYSSFSCLADKCRHSCCIGWEIDIDEDTAEIYRKLPGALGQELRRKTELSAPEHFILDEQERCPFLNGQGLCRLILSSGEDILCDICSEHPRYYNYIADREERGLGACCEMAAGLIIGGDGNISLCLYDDDGEAEETDECAAHLLSMRDTVVSAFAGTDGYYRKAGRAADALGIKLPAFDYNFWADFLLRLEILDEQWRDALKNARSVDITQKIDDPAYTRITEYFIYRYFASLDIKDAPIELAFAVLSTEIICTLASEVLSLDDALRMYSAEIEYAQENIDAVRARLRQLL